MFFLSNKKENIGYGKFTLSVTLNYKYIEGESQHGSSTETRIASLS